MSEIKVVPLRVDDIIQAGPNDAVTSGNYTVESHTEHESRVRQSEEQARHDRKKDIVLFYFGVALVGVAILGGLAALMWPTSSPVVRDTGNKVLVNTISGFIGYLVGSRSSKK